MVRVAVAGSSGSIGTQTLDVVRAEPDRYEVVGLGVGSSVDTLIAQALELRPKVVAVADPARRAEVADALPFAEVVADLADLAADADVVVNGVVGFAGLPVTLGHAAPRASAWPWPTRRSLIAAGPVVQPLAGHAGRRARPGRLRALRRPPVPAGQRRRRAASCRRIVLTASGGPFRGRTRGRAGRRHRRRGPRPPDVEDGPEDHRRLVARSMNKGLEVIEAHELFGVPYDQIEVVVHPQSIVHSMVEFTDGADHRPALAARHAPADRLRPGLPGPHRHAVRPHRLGRAAPARLRAARPRRPSAASALAYEAGRVGGTAPAWLNAANEVAVAGVPRRADRLDRRSLTFSTPSFPGMMGRWPTAWTP